MERKLDLPYATSAKLPPYQGIFAVDAKGFTERPGRQHQSISGLIPRLVGEAFGGAGLGEVWNAPTFFGPTGDGFAVGLPTAMMPFVLHPTLSELQRVLAQHNREIRAADPRLRLRVSLNVGPVEQDANPYLGGNGAARNDTHRLLDSVPVKAILAEASPNVTFVAAIISERVYRDVVEQGYAGLHPDHLIEVSATVPGKRFERRAWLYVPEPSGNLMAAAAPPTEPDPEREPVKKPSERGPAGGSVVMNVPNSHGPVTGTVNGDMNWTSGGWS